MITAACRSGLDTLRAVTQGRVSVDALMSQLNHTIHKAGRRKFTMTFVGLLYEPRTGEAMLASAGHPFPLLARRQGARVELRPLVARGSRLGDQPESEYVPVREVLQVGDLLCLFSDGLTEARSPQGVFFGERRLGRLLQQHFDLSPEAALEKIVAEWAAFVGAQPQEDDLTLVLARVER
jgi:sigma-B regulation protein RsbU (phosphoserine phosphatase)